MKKWLIRTLAFLAVMALATGWEKSQISILADVIIIVVWLHLEWTEWLRDKVHNLIKNR